MLFGSLQLVIYFVIAVGAFVFEIWAFIDALRYPSAAFVAAGKQTKTVWGGLLGAAAAVGFLGLPPPLGLSFTSAIGLIGLAGIVVAGIYATGVRPALAAIGRGRRPRRDHRGGW